MVSQRRSEQSIVKKRMEVVFILFMGAALVLGLRLAYLQAGLSHHFLEMANRMHGRTLELAADRGRVRDRNGAELATDVLGKAIAVNPRLVRDPAATASRLAELLGLTDAQESAIRTRIERARERRTFYSQLRRGVDRKLALGILERAKKEPVLEGVWLEDSPMRVNPSGRDGIQIVGSVSMDGRGQEGIEHLFDSILRGRSGTRRVRISATGVTIPESETREVEPVDGKDVRLTLDRDIQHFVEAELDRVAGEQKPDAATAIVMDVKTGDILAMANWPTFDPRQKSVTAAQRRNRAVTDLYEPGSTFKVVTAAAALEYQVPTSAYCGGSRGVGKRTIRCAHGTAHRAVNLRRMIEQSCNVAAGTLAERVGPARLHAFLVNWGFRSKTGVEFPGEERGWLAPPDKWRPINTVNIGFGQGISMTPLQLLTAYAAIANDGIYMPPRLVLEAPGTDLPERPSRRVMSAGNAALLREHMAAVVTEGTGKAAKIAGYSAAGKTGTAQIVKDGRYVPGSYLASFVGFLPARTPRLAILVSVWHPRNGQYGGVVAAPVFREIARQSVAFLKIPPDAPGDLRDGTNPASFYRAGRGGAAVAD